MGWIFEKLGNEFDVTLGYHWEPLVKAALNVLLHKSLLLVITIILHNLCTETGKAMASKNFIIITKYAAYRSVDLWKTYISSLSSIDKLLFPSFSIFTFLL